MTKSSSSSKPKASPTVSPEAPAQGTPQQKRVIPLKLLLDELVAAEQDAPISVRQARVLVASLISLQNVVVSVMDTMDKNTEVMNRSHENSNLNFFNLLSCLQQVAGEVGIEIRGINEEVETPPPGTIKH